MNEHIEQMARIKEVCKSTTFAKSTIWQHSKENKFPKPIKLSSGVTVWRIKDINDFINGLWTPKKEVKDETNDQ